MGVVAVGIFACRQHGLPACAKSSPLCQAGSLTYFTAWKAVLLRCATTREQGDRFGGSFERGFALAVAGLWLGALLPRCWLAGGSFCHGFEGFDAKGGVLERPRAGLQSPRARGEHLH